MESDIYRVKGRKGWYGRKQKRNKERKDKTFRITLEYRRKSRKRR